MMGDSDDNSTTSTNTSSSSFCDIPKVSTLKCTFFAAKSSCNSNADAAGIVVSSSGSCSNINQQPTAFSQGKKRPMASSSAKDTTSTSAATTFKKPRVGKKANQPATAKSTKKTLQAGIVLEEDIFVDAASTNTSIAAASEDNNNLPIRGPTKREENESYANRFIRQQHERIANGEPPILFEDEEFGPEASSIDGSHKISMFRAKKKSSPNAITASTSTTVVTTNGSNPWIHDDDDDGDDSRDPTLYFPKCWCKHPAKLCFKRDNGKAYFACSSGGAGTRRENNNNNPNSRRCRYFSWAFRSELMPWYRFGQHNQHVLVKPPTTTASVSTWEETETIFSAYDLVQGKVGDCWFLSALAVVAERPDLIQRLFQQKEFTLASSATTLNAVITNWQTQNDQWGMVQVNLFLDGFWTQVIMDNFLPCIVGQINPKEEDELKRAIGESLKSFAGDGTTNTTTTDMNNKIGNPYAKQLTHSKGRRLADGKVIAASTASDRDPLALSVKNLQIMQDTKRFLDKQRYNKTLRNDTVLEQLLDRPAESQDLAYSKARRNQLWVPFLEKAYAKIHGSYSAISGGHIAEAFLDLTGAPTLQIQWHQNGARHNSNIIEPRTLWSKLLQWRAKRLPMGCGTDSSAEGIIGMHAYSILDVREISNVGVEFFQEQLLTGTLGNVSGFTEYDGKVRLLRIRNPHGQGEWKGDFSDKSTKWKELLLATGVTLPRTMTNDGTFWMDYDNFLLGFANIDVVLAFQGNHAKSFATNFPPKKSNHRCARAFEVSLIDPQPGIVTKDRVEVYVLGIQKNRRGAKQGRLDRKKSYQVSDLGMLVAEYPLQASPDGTDTNVNFSIVHGQMFGFRRNGHYRLILDRKKCTRMVVMPVSFGHPAATDKEFSFAVRFNAEYPLMIRELEAVPRLDQVISDFLFQPKPATFYSDTRQGQKKVLWQNSSYKVVQVDCLGNQGGTVFIYLCAKALKVGEKSNPMSFSMEANCRGMSCRTLEGLLEYETVAKGKKFTASWRKFTASFTLESNKSRLLMVLYQSGQDTEMGSVVCRMGNVLGGTEPVPKSRPTTLDRFWSTGHHDDDSCCNYADQGIFHPIKSMDTDFFRLCGRNQGCSDDEWIDFSIMPKPNNVEQHDLQRAIDLSCDEQQADADLEEALRRSHHDTGHQSTGTTNFFPPAAGHDNVETIQDTDLARAIELSLKATTEKKYRNETIDLTSSGGKQAKTDKKEIILLDDSDDEHDDKTEQELTVRPGTTFWQSPNQFHQDKEVSVESKSSSKSDCDLRTMKRKLAAEAALKRIEGQKIA